MQCTFSLTTLILFVTIHSYLRHHSVIQVESATLSNHIHISVSSSLVTVLPQLISLSVVAFDEVIRFSLLVVFTLRRIVPSEGYTSEKGIQCKHSCFLEESLIALHHVTLS